MIKMIEIKIWVLSKDLIITSLVHFFLKMGEISEFDETQRIKMDYDQILRKKNQFTGQTKDPHKVSI